MVGLKLIILILSIVCITLGAILGVARGSRRAFLRIILIAGCAVGAYFLLDLAFDKVLEFQIGGKTLDNHIISLMGSEAENYADLLLPVIKAFLKVVTYLVLFIALQFVSLLLQVILYIFVRPHKDSNGIIHKHGAIGFVFGLVQGAMVALVFAVCLGGIAKNVQKIVDANIEQIQVPDAMNLHYDEYENAFPGIVYIKAQDPLFNMIATYTDEDGKKYTLDEEVDALIASMKVANAMSGLSSADFSSGFNDTNKATLLSTLDSISDILSVSNLSDGSKDIMNNIINTLISSQDLGVNVNINVKDIDFANEKKLVNDLVDLQNGNDLNVTTLVTSLSNSNITLALLEATDVKVELTADKKSEAEAALANVTNAETKAAIKNMLGL